MYVGLPSDDPVTVMRLTAELRIAVAMPKSAMIAWPSLIRMFDGLMSRWTTPCSCA